MIAVERRLSRSKSRADGAVIEQEGKARDPTSAATCGGG
ncbi:hypothetical protein CEV34_4238 [Brucella pseudogrignonensis]|uniref:Uncharacterized protein n=1 Tax=Brucella pseudogrignonensis TaxID=419475 RepID=A0A256G625_9HYPH|nr:hypothetical protein CEV34_4238 [Brucella pseudogrignonensis]